MVSYAVQRCNGMLQLLLLFLFYIVELNLDYIVDNAWIVIPCSALKTINVNEVLEWLVKQGK